MKGSLFYRDNYWTKVRSGKFLMTTGDCAVKSVLQTTGNREHYGLMVLVRATSPVSRSSQARASLVLTRPRRPGQQQTTLSHCTGQEEIQQNIALQSPVCSFKCQIIISHYCEGYQHMELRHSPPHHAIIKITSVIFTPSYFSYFHHVLYTHHHHRLPI